jgi:ectoine hydroxylase
MSAATPPLTDRYPTRDAEGATTVSRRDPVVWGGGSGGPLARHELERFETAGYLPIAELVDHRQLQGIRAEIGRLVGEADPDDERVVLERHGTAVRSLFEVHRTSELFAELAARPALAGRARQLLGSDVYLHQSRINLKPGFRGKEFGWHSDFETWHAEDGMPSMRAVSLSLALSANEPWNGSLLVIPRSHRHFVACRGATPDDHYRRSLRTQEIGVPTEADIGRLVAEGGIEMLCGPAGSATLFDCNMMHGSNGNITPSPRVNLFLVYNSVDNALVEPFAAPAQRPTFIASRTFEPVQ